MRRTLLAMTAVGVALAARAGDGGKLQGAVMELLDGYQDALVRGEKDEELGALLREVRKAQKAGDWDKVAGLLKDYDRGRLKRPEEDDASVLAAEKEPEVKFNTTKEKYASGDLAIGAFFYEPAVVDSKSAGIVLVHDGTRGMRAYVRALADDLAGAGYALYLPYLRGQGGSEGRVEFLGGEVGDVVNAVKVLRSKELVKEDQVSLLGIGDGGALALLAANRLGDQVKYTVALSPVTDLVSLLRDVPRWKADLRRLRLDWSIEDKDELRSRSPVFEVTNIDEKVKILVMHGKLDRRIPVSQAEGYCAVLKHRAKSYEFKVYEAAGEKLVQQRRTYIEDLKRFLKKGTTKAPKKKAKPKGGGEQQRQPRQRARREG